MSEIDYKIYIFQDLLKSSVALIISLAVVYFLVGLFKYIVSKNEAERAKGKNHAVTGIIILFVMMSMWGIVYLFRETFQVGNRVPSARFIDVNRLIKK
jgi:uncharacterized membrane-anchored protein